MPYTDLFNTTITTVKDKLEQVAGLAVIDNPQNAAGMVNGFVLMQAPSFEAFNANVATVTFELQIVLPGQGNLAALQAGLDIAADLMDLNIAVLSGRPSAVEIGGAESPAYTLTFRIGATTT